MNLKEILKDFDFSIDDRVLEEYSQDKSIFKIKPKAVIFPKNSEEIKKIVKIVKENYLSITCRAAGTDMSGGSLTDSILIVFTKYMNKILEINSKEKYVIVQPGVYFRDLEKELSKYNLMLPSYPASKEMCAIGGMVANDSGGEKSLKYGKTHNYVIDLKVILSDGNEYNLANEKILQTDFYQKTQRLLKENFHLIQKMKPKVTKNSSGYNIWDAVSGIYRGEHACLAVGQEKNRTDEKDISVSSASSASSSDDSVYSTSSQFIPLDLVKLFVGSQGTLGIITEIKIKLVEKEKFSNLLVVFIKDLKDLPLFTQNILKLQPTSLEITDDHTFRIFLKFAKEMASLLGAKGFFSTIRLFLPEIFIILKMGLPKLIVLTEFTSDNKEEIEEKIKQAEEIAEKYRYLYRRPQNEQEIEKYWRLRRDTYRLLREKIKKLTASPFIDDFIISPEYLSEFLPKLYQILDEYKLIYTISGHLGDGNLHIIPLVNLKDENQRKNILEITDKVYNLVLQHNGILTAEHNDGLIRGPYLEKEFGKEIYNILKEIKNIFDPQNIFNPYKKVTASKENIERFMIK